MIKKVLGILFLLVFSVLCSCSILGGGVQGGGLSNEASSPAQSSGGQSSNSTPSEQAPDVELHIWQEDGLVKWTDVSAALYKVEVNYQTYNTADCFVEADLSAGIYEVTVRAYFTIEPLVYRDFTGEVAIRERAPVLTVEGRTLTWNRCYNNVVYNVYKNGSYYTQVSTNYFTATEDGLYCVSVVYPDNRLSSDLSNQVAVGSVPLTAPVLTLNGSVLSWTAVPGADVYVILAEGEVVLMMMGEDATTVDFSSTYDEKLKEKYPSGVNVCVYARSDGAEDGPRSNAVFFTVG